MCCGNVKIIYYKNIGVYDTLSGGYDTSKNNGRYDSQSLNRFFSGTENFVAYDTFRIDEYYQADYCNQHNSIL